MRLEGGAVIVTGAAQGIGEAIALHCAQEGASVLAIDVDPAVERIGAALALVGDVVDPDLPERAVTLARERFGGLTGLVNNAGVVPEAEVLATTDEVWTRTLEVNLTAPMRWSRAALPALLESGAGAIVNLTSIEATHVRPRHGAYVASKGGLLAFTRALAIEYGRRGVRANALSPGSIETPLFRSYVQDDPDLEHHLVDLNYVGRLGTTSEVALACVHLLSAESAFTNGAELVVDGGRLAAT